MDGRVGAIREALDASGFEQVSILAYTAKYASCFMVPSEVLWIQHLKRVIRKPIRWIRNWREALREAELDISEGADVIMVKPALGYLDVITRLREAFDVPIAAYNVLASMR